MQFLYKQMSKVGEIEPCFMDAKKDTLYPIYECYKLFKKTVLESKSLYSLFSN